MQLYCLLLAFSLLSAATGMQLLGANRCTWGPSWWCRNETTANDCGAIEHCIQKVWKSVTPQKVPKPNDAMSTFLQNPLGLLPVGVHPKQKHGLRQDACDTCEDRVLEIKVLIKNNATSQAFEKLIVQECTKWFSNEDSCSALVSQSSDAIFSIVRRLSPEQVCDLVLQCGNLCSECKSELSVAEEALEQNLTQQEIVALFLDFCTKLGPYSDVCKTAITSRMDIVIDDLVTFLQNDPCSYLGVCGSSHQVAKVGGGKECTLCMFMWEYVLHALSENETDQAIKKELEALCELLGNKYDGICENIIDSNFDFLIKTIIDKESPHKFCTQISACNSTDAFALIPLPKQSPSALLCSALASIFQSMIGTELVVKSIVQVVYMTCNILPDDTSVENCQSFVMLYVAGILQLINAALPISYICVAFLGNNPSQISALYDSSLTFNPEIRGFVECSICELVLEIVRMDIDSPKSVKDIQDDVNMTCQWFPEGSLRRDCETAVILVPVVLDMLAQNVDPDKICQFVDACANSTKSDTSTALTQIGSQEVDSFDLACFSCKAGVHLAFSFISSNSTLQEVIILVDNICAMINRDYGCEEYLNELLPPIIKYIEQQFSPEDVCISFGICESDEVGEYTMDNNAPIEQVQDAGCLLCSALATILDDYTEAYDEEAIIEIAGELCNQFGVFSDECKSIVANELPSIIEKLREGETPQELCSEVELCQVVTSRVSVSLLQRVSSSERESENESECETCLDAINSIDTMLSEEGEEYTREYLMEQCVAAYPKSVCKQAISQLIKMVESGEIPSKICANLDLCDLNSQVQGYIDCDTCENYGKMMQDKIASNMSSDDFKQMLFDICDQEDIKNCKLYVRMYYLILYKLVVSDGQSYTQVCQEFSFCSATSLSEKNPNSLSSSTKLCAECKFIISLAKQLISNADEDQIEKNLDYVCSMLGSDKYENCVKLLDSFVSHLYDILSGDITVTELCEEINACSSSEMVTLQKTYMQLWEQLQQSPSTDCVLCTWISHSIHPELVATYSQESLKHNLVSKCSLLPKHNQPICAEFLNNSYFVSTLKNAPYSPVCETTNICPTKPRSKSGFSLFI